MKEELQTIINANDNTSPNPNQNQSLKESLNEKYFLLMLSSKLKILSNKSETYSLTKSLSNKKNTKKILEENNYSTTFNEKAHFEDVSKIYSTKKTIIDNIDNCKQVTSYESDFLADSTDYGMNTCHPGCIGSNPSLFANVSANSKFSYAYALPIIYFIVSILSLFVLIFLNFYELNFFNLSNFKKIGNTPKLKNEKKINSPFFLFPNFYELKKIQPVLFSISVSIISITGLLSVWFYCSMILQRFSVPEFRNNKIIIHIMFILGILSNFLILFFGISQNFLKWEAINSKEIKTSFPVIIFLTFIFLNILFAFVGMKSLEYLQKQVKCNDEFFSSKLKAKRVVIYLCLFLLLIYIIAFCINQNLILQASQKIYSKKVSENKKFWGSNYKTKRIENIVFHFILAFFPYFLFILNAFLNLWFYSDIIYLQKKLNTIVDIDYFLSQEENIALLV